MAHESGTTDTLGHLWRSTIANIQQGVFEVVVPAADREKLSLSDLSTLKCTFEKVIGVHASIFVDPQSGNATRMIPPTGWRNPFNNDPIRLEVIGTSEQLHLAQPVDANDDQTSMLNIPESLNRLAPNPKAKIARARSNKVPRPPNAFILYRQHHHPLVKSQDPSLHNNDISILIGNQWKNESEQVKNFWRHEAEIRRQRHHAENPGYQYAPRKSIQKRRRASTATNPTIHSQLPSQVGDRDLSLLLAEENAFAATLAPSNGCLLEHAEQTTISWPKDAFQDIGVNFLPGAFDHCLHSLDQWNDVMLVNDPGTGRQRMPIQGSTETNMLAMDKAFCVQNVDVDGIFAQLMTKKTLEDAAQFECSASGDLFTPQSTMLAAAAQDHQGKNANQLRRFDREEFRTKGHSLFDSTLTVSATGPQTTSLAAVLQDNLPAFAREPTNAQQVTLTPTPDEVNANTPKESFQLPELSIDDMSRSFLHLHDNLYENDH